jgi:aminopeptidase C
MMKNSWGDYNKYHGKAYITKAYMAYKTMNIFINKNAIPKDIAKKIGL